MPSAAAIPLAGGLSTSSTRSSASGSAGPRTRSGSPFLDGSRGPLDRRLQSNGGLAHTDSSGLELEAVDQRVSHCGGHGLEEAKLPARRHLLHAANHVAVVDRRLETVGRRGVRNLETEVVEERLRATPFLLFDPVRSGDLETVELGTDAHQATIARAAVSASTCSHTSCTRKIDAPRS